MADPSVQHTPWPVVVIVGPTATGKTQLGFDIARWLGSEVISADSQQIYKHLDIGTAKPTANEAQGIPCHLVDFVEPDAMYSASQFRDDATLILERLRQAGKIPVVVGGTGFYLRALLEGEGVSPVEPNPAFRDHMAQLAQTHGGKYLHQLLMEKDQRRGAQLHSNDTFRVIRALEIIEATGQPVEELSDPTPSALPWQCCWIGLTYEDRDHHRSLIAQRAQAMMAAGWLDEVKSLMERYGPDVQALQVAHGYPELVDVCLGKRTLEDAVAQLTLNVQQYARRQRTWFRRNNHIHWISKDLPCDWNAVVVEAQGVITACIPASAFNPVQ